MAAITPPDLDPRDEDTLTAEVIDQLPAELSDRNAAAFVVAVIEACGAYYAALVYLLNAVSAKLQLQLLAFLGLSLTDPTAAAVILSFTATGAGATVPAGTIVKTGTGTDAIKFATDAELVLAPSATDTVTATATTTGTATNVGANTLQTLDAPVSGVDSVTNPASASGGADLETTASLIERAPLVIRSSDRAITDEDFELHATNNASVIRAKATGDGSGSVAVALIVDDLNERFTDDWTNATDAAIRAAVELDLEARTIPGVVVTATQYAPRLFVLSEVEVELAAGYTAATVKANIVATMAAMVSAEDILAADGTIATAAWDWGATFYVNEAIAAIDGTAGVKRVGTIKAQQSDDFGTTFSTEAVLTTIAAGRDGNDDAALGMLHWGADYKAGYTGPTIVEL